MNVTRMQVISEARLWVGTRYYHHGRKRGVSVDCLGLMIGVRQGLGLPVHDNKKYNRYGIGDGVLEDFKQYFEFIHPEHARPGDWVGFQVLKPGLIQHVGLLTDVGILHTNDRIGRVVETSIDPRLRKMMVQGFRMKEMLEVG